MVKSCVKIQVQFKGFSIIIDKFDCPLKELPKRALGGIKKELELFYMEMKAAAVDSELWFVLILGVNNLQILSAATNGLVRDITFDDKFSSIMGFFANETEKSFKPHLDKFAEERGWNTPDTDKKIENRYGGYRFSKKNKDAVVLDTGSVCSCLREFALADSEPKTVTLENIVERMIKEDKGVDYFKYYCINESELRVKYNAKNNEDVPLYIQMLCNGYVTIKKYRPKKQEVCLSYPNEGIEKL